MPVLKAKINGVWVPLGSGGSGSDEVEVGPTIPTDPGIELWYDTDDPQGQAGGVPAAGAVGQVLTKLGNEDYNVGWVGGIDYAKMPRGFIAQASPSADTNGIGSSMTDVTGMAVSWTAEASRRYRISAFSTCAMGTGTPPGTATYALVTGSAALVRRVAHTFGTLTYSTVLHVWSVESGLIGAQTRKIQANISAGTLNVNGGTYPGIIVVEDIGGV